MPIRPAPHGHTLPQLTISHSSCRLPSLPPANPASPPHGAPFAPRSRARRKLDEKKNVWIALLNLEKAHGTPETLAAVFRRSCADQNGKHMYLQMAAVHERAADDKAVLSTYDAVCKHYRQSKKVWLAKMEWAMRRGDADAAKATLERSLQSLPRRKHVPTIVKFAQLEYRHGARRHSRRPLRALVATGARACLSRAQERPRLSFCARARALMRPPRWPTDPIPTHPQPHPRCARSAGSVERARTVLDGVMAHHPKRLDLWGIYLDMETRKGARTPWGGARGMIAPARPQPAHPPRLPSLPLLVPCAALIPSLLLPLAAPSCVRPVPRAADAGTLVPDVRRLFERVAALKLSSKKMKYVFKRWLGWEQAHGSAATIARVKDKAREYVQLKAGGDDTAVAEGADSESEEEAEEEASDDDDE